MIYEWFFTQDQNIERVLLPTVSLQMVGQTKSWGLHGFKTTLIQQHDGVVDPGLVSRD